MMHVKVSIDPLAPPPPPPPLDPELVQKKELGGMIFDGSIIILVLYIINCIMIWCFVYI